MQRKISLIGFAFILILCFTGCDTTTGSTKSSNAQLKLLSIKDGEVELISNFDVQTTSYSVNVPYTTLSVSVYAETAAQESCLVYWPEITNEEVLLAIGNNIIELTVIAENGKIQNNIYQYRS
jgi:hypothetical protein